MVDDSSKKQVLVALTVTLGKHILHDYVRCEFCQLPILKFHLVRLLIEDWIGVSFASMCPVGLALPSADLGIHHNVRFPEYNFGTHILIISIGICLVVVIAER